METLVLFAFVVSLALCIGINPYLTFLTIALVAQSDLSIIPSSLYFITNDLVITILVILVIINFIADMTPALDSAWDLFHTVLRIPLAVILCTFLIKGSALHIEKEHLIIYQGGAFIVSLMVVVISHFGKSSLRAFLNSKIHPWYNWLASLFESCLIIGLIALTVYQPTLSYILSISALLLLFWVIPRTWRYFHHYAIALFTWTKNRKGWQETDSFFD